MWATTAILMDEPTAALGTKQTDLVYDSIRSAAKRGLAVVVISHDIPRMLDLADRIAVMRQGRTVATLPARDLTLSDIVTLMLGGKTRGEAAPDGGTSTRTVTTGAPAGRSMSWVLPERPWLRGPS
jgi:simple sugar transport system ATP-binding protein